MNSVTPERIDQVIQQALPQPYASEVIALLRHGTVNRSDLLTGDELRQLVGTVENFNKLKPCDHSLYFVFQLLQFHPHCIANFAHFIKISCFCDCEVLMNATLENWNEDETVSPYDL